MHCGKKTRSGGTCLNWVLPGQRVCRMHGGKAPQALAKAEDRLRALEFPAIATLQEVMRHGDTDAVRFAAARWLLEVLGHKATVTVQGEHEITIRVIDEAQPIVIEHAHHLNGRTDS
jgi:hypothetical protein